MSIEDDIEQNVTLCEGGVLSRKEGGCFIQRLSLPTIFEFLLLGMKLSNSVIYQKIVFER